MYVGLAVPGRSLFDNVKSSIFALISINQELRNKPRFTRKQTKEWDKFSEEADKALDQAAKKFAGIRRAAGIAWIQATASPAKSETSEIGDKIRDPRGATGWRWQRHQQHDTRSKYKQRKQSIWSQR